jgi:hypothetical protein
MSEMKSAFEKAWERAQSLGRLSPEEMEQRKREELTPSGQGLAERYLRHGYSDILIDGVDKYSGEERGIVTKTVLSRLVEAIELENGEITMRAMEGIMALVGEGAVVGIRQGISDIFQEYEQAKGQEKQRKRGQIERERTEALHQLRISGSAVAGVNIESHKAWEGIFAGLRSSFSDRLRQTKQELSSVLDL